MEKKSKRELIELISQHEERVNRYETRFTDVVKAYKSLAKEKDALESTVKALSTQASPKRKIESPNVSTPTDKDPLGALGQNSDQSQHEKEVEATDTNEIPLLEIKIETLSKALATVTEEKSKMEAAYQADKKKSIELHRADIDQYCKTVDNLKSANEDLETKLSQAKSKICQQQTEREKEQEDHAVMLQEFQILLSKERRERENADNQLKEKVLIQSDDKEANEMKINDLEVELAILQDKLKQAEVKDQLPTPDSLKVMEDLYREREQHELELTAEKRRAINAEENLRLFSINTEKRTAEMENQITEMASMLGKYEHTHCEDQKKINKLKDQLALLGDDNRLLADKVKEAISPSYDELETIDSLREEIYKLKGKLHLSTTGNAFPTTGNSHDTTQLEEDLKEFYKNDDGIHQKCFLVHTQLREENNKLKEKLKVNPQSKSSDNSPKELVFLKQRSDTLEQELTAVRDYYDNKEHELALLVSKLQCDITRLEDDKKEIIKETEEKCKDQIQILNEELRKQRNRTVDLLAEKDLEINRLTNLDHSFSKEPDTTSLSHWNRTENIETNHILDSDKDKPDISNLLSSKTNGSNGLVHYSQQLDRLGNDLTSARFENEDMRLGLRDAELREEKVIQQMHFLKEEIRKLERDRSRETANLEYLKNVVLRYLLTDTVNVRHQMTSAMATILQFSPAEVKQVRKKELSWWSTS